MSIPPEIAAVVLGVIEGVTEFLPVSSTAHLLLADALVSVNDPHHVFEIAIQLGAILAVVVLYWKPLWHMATRWPVDAAARRQIVILLLGFLPAALVGVLAHDFIKSVLFNPWVIAVALIAGGIAILLIEKRSLQPRHKDLDQLPMRTALGIGCMQCLAMIPGVSRSGATIMGAMLMGVDRATAAGFSFLLAIPTMAGATAYDVYKNMDALTASQGVLMAIGFVTAFVAALPIVRGLIAFVGRHGFAPFAWYRIALGTVVLAVLIAV